MDAYAAPAHGGDCISGVADAITSHGNDEFLLSFSLPASCCCCPARIAHRAGNCRGDGSSHTLQQPSDLCLVTILRSADRAMRTNILQTVYRYHTDLTWSL